MRSIEAPSNTSQHATKYQRIAQNGRTATVFFLCIRFCHRLCFCSSTPVLLFFFSSFLLFRLLFRLPAEAMRQHRAPYQSQTLTGQPPRLPCSPTTDVHNYSTAVCQTANDSPEEGPPPIFVIPCLRAFYSSGVFVARAVPTSRPLDRGILQWHMLVALLLGQLRSLLQANSSFNGSLEYAAKKQKPAVLPRPREPMAA